MRKLLFLVLLLASFIVYAQEGQFVRSYHKMTMLDGKGKPIANPVENKSVFVFNYGEGKDVKAISEDGEVEIFIRVSDVNTIEQDGKTCQYFTVISKEGNQYIFALFEDSFHRILMDKNNNILLSIKFF